ncbi:MAG: hypothetical protein GY756_27885 [bacterium]|nr:hypothetical protein [bacterium]
MQNSKKMIKIYLFPLLVIIIFTGCQTTTNEMNIEKEEQIEELSILEILNKNQRENRIKKVSTTLYSNSEIKKEDRIFKYDNLDRVTEITNIYFPFREFNKILSKTLIFYSTDTKSSDDILYKDIGIENLRRYYIDSSKNKITTKFFANNENIEYDLDIPDEYIAMFLTGSHSDIENKYQFAEEILGIIDENFYLCSFDFYKLGQFKSHYVRFNRISMINQIMILNHGVNGEKKLEKKIITDNTGKIIRSLAIIDNEELTETIFFYDDSDTLSRIETYLHDNTLIVSRDFEFEQESSNLNLTFF